MTKKQKLYCYVDETGQDTQGEFFIVAVIVSGEDRDALASKLEKIEQASGKGKAKWMKVRRRQRLPYIQQVLSLAELKNALYFSFYRGTKSYMALTVLSTAKAILLATPAPSQSTVYVDGLPRPRLRWFGTELRHLSVHSSKVVGVRREEASTLMRLADALAGFVRLALLGQDKEMTALFHQAERGGYIKEI